MIVLDCSAAMGIVRKTEDGQALRALVGNGERVIAPMLFQAEAANACFRTVCHAHEPKAKSFEAMNIMLDMVDEYVDMKDLVAEATSEAMRMGHSAYDLVYFVLARRRHATLVTLDRKLMALCVEHGVDCIGEVAL